MADAQHIMQLYMTTSAMNVLLKSDSKMLLTVKKELPTVMILLNTVELKIINVLLNLLSESHVFQTVLTTITCVNQTFAWMTLTSAGNANQIAIVKIKILNIARPAQINAYKKTEV